MFSGMCHLYMFWCTQYMVTKWFRTVKHYFLCMSCVRTADNFIICVCSGLSSHGSWMSMLNIHPYNILEIYHMIKPCTVIGQLTINYSCLFWLQIQSLNLWKTGQSLWHRALLSAKAYFFGEVDWLVGVRLA